MMDWFRSYHGAHCDAKLRVVAKRSETQAGVAAAIWWALLDYASQHPDRGSVAGFDCETLACAYDWPEDLIARVIEAMREKELITDDRITNWEKRQPKREDHSTDRVRALRERQRQDRNAVKRNETQGNARVEEKREDDACSLPAQSAGIVGVAIGEIAETAVLLTRTANRAIATRWGEQPNVLIHNAAGSTQAAEAVVAEKIDIEIARSSIAAQCKRSRASRPPSSLSYFLPGIRDDWASEQARRDAATSSDPAELVANGTGPPFARRAGAARKRQTPQQYAPYDTSGNDAALRRLGVTADEDSK